jgi:hypothetical protein
VEVVTHLKVQERGKGNRKATVEGVQWKGKGKKGKGKGRGLGNLFELQHGRVRVFAYKWPPSILSRGSHSAVRVFAYKWLPSILNRGSHRQGQGGRVRVFCLQIVTFHFEPAAATVRVFLLTNRLLPF